MRANKAATIVRRVVRANKENTAWLDVFWLIAWTGAFLNRTTATEKNDLYAINAINS
jgi:hypothetical protein